MMVDGCAVDSYGKATVRPVNGHRKSTDSSGAASLHVTLTMGDDSQKPKAGSLQNRMCGQGRRKLLLCFVVDIRELMAKRRKSNFVKFSQRYTGTAKKVLVIYGQFDEKFGLNLSTFPNV